MRIFGGLKDCDCSCDTPKKPSEAGPKTGAREDLASGQCCAGKSDSCCKDEVDPNIEGV